MFALTLFVHVLFISVLYVFFFCFFFKQKTAYEMRISDWSSDVCSSDLLDGGTVRAELPHSRPTVGWSSPTQGGVHRFPWFELPPPPGGRQTTGDRKSVV